MEMRYKTTFLARIPHASNSMLFAFHDATRMWLAYKAAFLSVRLSGLVSVRFVGKRC